MLETAIALLAAHMAADFVFQFNAIIANKTKAWAFALHVVIVFVFSALALGAVELQAKEAIYAVALVTVSHAVIDAIKTFVLRRACWEKPVWDFTAFSLDQLAHLAFIGLAACLFSDAFAGGAWGWRAGEGAEVLLTAYAVFAGFIAATRMGEFAIGKFLDRFDLGTIEVKADGTQAQPDDGLSNGGAWIGLLERGAIFALVLVGQFTAIGFLLAAKSVLRFQYANERSQSEYVIIGTLTSFGWATAMGGLTVWAMNAIPTA